MTDVLVFVICMIDSLVLLILSVYLVSCGSPIACYSFIY